MQTVVIVPPVAVTNIAPAASSLFPESVTIQPFVESTKTKVIAEPCTFNTASSVDPSILSEPFCFNIQLAVLKLFA